jgi:hypothetical protein
MTSFWYPQSGVEQSLPCGGKILPMEGTDGTNDKQNSILSTPCNKTTPARLRVFLDVYTRTAHVRLACQAAGINHKTHYRHLATDPLYRLAVEQAELRIDRVMFGLIKRFRRERRRERVLAEVAASVNLLERMEAAEEGLAIIRVAATTSGRSRRGKIAAAPMRNH